MKIQIIYFDGCPNAEAARSAVARALEAEGMPREFEQLDTNAADPPEPLKTWGSPTVLVDGTDVGGELEPTGTSCRLYANPDNRGVPSDAAIREAIRRRGTNDASGMSKPGAQFLIGMRGKAMKKRTMLGIGLGGTLAVAICCFTPTLVALLGAVGLSAGLVWLDYVLLPLLVLFAALTLLALIRRSKSAS